MKVALVCSSFAPGGGGAERQLERVLRALTARGHETVVLTRHRDDSPDEELMDGVRVRRIAAGPPPLRLPAVIRVERALEHERPDVVIASQAGSALGVSVAASLRHRHVRVVLRLTGGDHFGSELEQKSRLRLTRRRTSLLLRRCDAVVAPADHILDHATDFADELHGKCFVIPNGAPKPTSAGSGPGPAAGAALWVGRPAPVKAYDVLVDLARRCPDVRFVAIGPEADPGDPPNLEALGWWPDAGAAFVDARVFVTTSRYEGTPNTMAEALVNGVPVVGFDIPGTREVARFAERGVRLVEREVELLEAALREALADTDGVIAHVPSIDDVTDGWATLIEGVAAGALPDRGPWLTRREPGSS